MKKLLLQHWDGPLNELAKKSNLCMQAYADYVGAEYRLLRGKIFHPDVEPPTQKMIMLDEQFDDYDVVVMTDCDMFTRDADDLLDIFTQEEGFGNGSTVQDGLRKQIHRRFPNKFDLSCSYWGGSTYRLPRWLRQKLRSVMDMNDVKMFIRRPHDEGFMYRLNTLAGIKGGYFPKDVRWQYPNFWEDIKKKSQFIHVRAKRMENGKILRTPKIENYRVLVNAGVIKDW